jgi:hypothetical protein
LQADHSDENQDQLCACCGEAPTSSVRTIRAGMSAERLLSTPPAYEGVAGTWAMRMSARDPHHAFLVMSFVSETRVLSVGLSFDDVTVRKPAVLAYAPCYKLCAPVLAWLFVILSVGRLFDAGESACTHLLGRPKTFGCLNSG